MDPTLETIRMNCTCKVCTDLFQANLLTSSMYCFLPKATCQKEVYRHLLEQICTYNSEQINYLSVLVHNRSLMQLQYCHN